MDIGDWRQDGQFWTRHGAVPSEQNHALGGLGKPDISEHERHQIKRMAAGKGEA